MQRSEFEEVLRSCISVSSDGSVGRLHLISLEEIAKRFGGDWQKLAAKAMMIAESVIIEKLSSHDAHVRISEDAFLILFSELSEIEAGFRSAVIAQRIKARLLGADNDRFDKLSVIHAVVPVNKLAEGGNLDNLLENAIKATEKREEQVTQAQVRGAPFLNSIDFDFLPIWSPEKEMIVAWRMRPYRQLGGTKLFDEQVFLGGASDPMTIELDLKSIAMGQEIADQCMAGKVSLVVPIHVGPNIMETKEALKRDIASFCTITSYAKVLSFEILGISDNMGRPLLREIVDILKTCSASVSARISPDSLHVGSLKECGVGFLGISLRQAMSSGFSAKQIRGLLAVFARDTIALGLAPYLWDADSIDDLKFAVSAGFKLISGAALGQPRNRIAPRQSLQLKNLSF
jgi:hypothetical protein